VHRRARNQVVESPPRRGVRSRSRSPPPPSSRKPLRSPGASVVASACSSMLPPSRRDIQVVAWSSPGNEDPTPTLEGGVVVRARASSHGKVPGSISL
jgi:hypothetical protein